MEKKYLDTHDAAIRAILRSADELQALSNAAYDMGQESLACKLQKINHTLECQATAARGAVSDSIRHEFDESVRSASRVVEALTATPQ